MTPRLKVACLIAIAAWMPATQAHGKKSKGPDEYLRTQMFANAPPAAQAVVWRLLVNPFGEVDGLMLDSGMLVTFPPHMSAALAAAVKTGDPVAVRGFPEQPNQIKGYVIVNLRTNQVLVIAPKHAPDAKMPKHLRSVGLKEMSAKGEIRQLRYSGKGQVNGVVLADGTSVRFAPTADNRIAPLLRAGQAVEASGYGTQNEFGRALEATALAAGGQPAQPLYTR